MLVHIRDPQFYAIPGNVRGKNGRLQVMGFPPIGIMSLSSVLKRAGHEVLLFDQANPETPNDVIVAEVLRWKPDLVGMSFLSTTSYPYAKILARALRAAAPEVKLAFGGVFATLNAEHVKRQVPEVDFVCRGDGEQLILDLVERLDDPAGVMGVTWQDASGAVRENPPRMLDRNLDQWPFPDRESLDARFRRVHAARRSGRAVARALHDHADLARLPVAVHLLRHPDLQRGQVALAQPRARPRRVRAAEEGRLRRRVLRRRPFPPPAQAHRGDLRGHQRAGARDPVGLRGARGLGLHGALPGDGEGALPHADVRHRERQPEDPRTG